MKNDQFLSYVKPSIISVFEDKFQEILVNNVRQGFIIWNYCRSILTWTSSDVMRKHSISCIKAKDLTPEIRPRIKSLFKETSQVTTLQQLCFFKNKFFMVLLEHMRIGFKPFQ